MSHLCFSRDLWALLCLTFSVCLQVLAGFAFS